MDGTVMEAYAEVVSLREEPPSLPGRSGRGCLQVTQSRSLKGGQNQPELVEAGAPQCLLFQRAA